MRVHGSLMLLAVALLVLLPVVAFGYTPDNSLDWLAQGTKTITGEEVAVTGSETLTAFAVEPSRSVPLEMVNYSVSTGPVNYWESGSGTESEEVYQLSWCS